MGLSATPHMNPHARAATAEQLGNILSEVIAQLTALQSQMTTYDAMGLEDRAYVTRTIRRMGDDADELTQAYIT